MRYLYWVCRKHTSHVFKTSDGRIPFKCEICDHPFVRACSKNWYKTMKQNQEIAFDDYQLRTGDKGRGSYGRFIWRYSFGSD